MKVDKFVVAIIIVIIVAYIFPEWGNEQHFLPLATITQIGVSLIFFFYGLKLSVSKIKDGLKNWKLHLLIQTGTFLLFPILVLICKPLVSTTETKSLWLSFMFLAALPSTVSSSVVMVSLAKGNIPAAIFNASISGLIGIAITPLWMEVFLPRSTVDFNLGSIYLRLIVDILIPVIFGLILQPYWGKYAQKYNSQLTSFDKLIILLIIYKSFAHSFEKQIFSTINFIDLLLITVLLLVLFFTIFYLIGFISNCFNFNREDRITAQFCGTKKSLVHGTVFASILFPSSFPIGLVLLPLMMFHTMQIFIVSMIALKRVEHNY
ncbi:bile acid:sodium symporter family protein [Cognatitamlana onchidii]|uniref:bile acid:sodium symporter family protein n=1 Tax=Cognatitamlana onchidii TaxID=2562860 RepID=UPI0010A5ED5E|nr:bile acid:sodium symporter family protein [Algibacter onchidii]